MFQRPISPKSAALTVDQRALGLNRHAPVCDGDTVEVAEREMPGDVGPNNNGPACVVWLHPKPLSPHPCFRQKPMGFVLDSNRRCAIRKAIPSSQDYGSRAANHYVAKAIFRITRMADLAELHILDDVDVVVPIHFLSLCSRPLIRASAKRSAAARTARS